MRIGIDTRMPTKNKTGIGYILDNILPRLVDIDNKTRYVLYGCNFGVDKNNVRTIKLPRTFQRLLNLFWKYIFFPSASIFIGKTDVFFFPNFTDFPVSAKKRVLLIADLSFIRFPNFSEKKNLVFLKRNVGSSIKRADHILTISENAKNEIVEYYGLERRKVDVIYLGCPENVKAITDHFQIENIKRKYYIKGQYILFVGTLEPRKNIEGIIRAYSLLDQDTRNKYKLVISGSKGWYYDKIFNIVDELCLRDNVVFTSYVDEVDISSLYSGASLFVFPSFYEGFGMPILEAFRCGIPVVTADNSSLREVGGDGCMYCNADSIESIKEAIEKVLNSENLKKELVLKGHEQLKRFSWDLAAKKIYEILVS